MGDRESSIPPPKKIAALVIGGIASAAGGAIMALCTSWIGGIVTQGELTKATAAIPALEKRVAETQKALSDVAQKQESGDLARRSAREMLVWEIRWRVGLQAAFAVAADPKRRESAERTAAGVRARYDDLVRQGVDPGLAAQQALEAALLQR